MGGNVFALYKGVHTLARKEPAEASGLRKNASNSRILLTKYRILMHLGKHCENRDKKCSTENTVSAQ